MTNGILDRVATVGTTTFSGPAFASVQQVGADTFSVPTGAADTTNGCLNVSWTPPNADTWHVVARVVTVEVE
jgi:hypothetical protein